LAIRYSRAGNRPNQRRSLYCSSTNSVKNLPVIALDNGSSQTTAIRWKTRFLVKRLEGLEDEALLAQESVVSKDVVWRLSTSASWLNMVEIRFGISSLGSPRGGSFVSTDDIRKQMAHPE
jgi:hypothetical protein